VTDAEARSGVEAQAGAEEKTSSEGAGAGASGSRRLSRLSAIVATGDHDRVAADLHQPRERALTDVFLQIAGFGREWPVDVGVDVGREHDRALPLVAGVDDQIELLEHPLGRSHHAQILDVQQVDV